MPKNKITNPRLILPRLRHGDYAHAGEKEAVDMVIEKIKHLIQVGFNISRSDNHSRNKKVLDVGCGLGGTAEYVRSKTFYDVYGVDMDESALAHARKRYPNVKFFQCNAEDIQVCFYNGPFDIIYMFNVFYVIHDQKIVLSKLANIAKPGAILVIFDYTQSSKNNIELNDFSEKPINPIYVDELVTMLKETGWGLIEVEDITYRYEEWYTNFMKDFKSHKAKLLDDFTVEAINKVDHTFTSLLKKIQDKEVGGGIICAIKSDI